MTSASQKPRQDRRLWYAAAALVLAMLAVGALLLIKRPKPRPPPMVVRAGDDSALPMPTPGPASVPVIPPLPPPQVEPPVVPEPPRRPTPVAEPKGNGVLQLALRQWAHVEIDGVALGRKQVSARFELPAGAHEIVVRNPTYGERSVRVSLRSGQTQSLVIDFTTSTH